jgi:hypothetical protein
MDVLLAHTMPDNIIISQSPPPPRYLSGFAKRCGIEVTKNLEGDLRGKGG